MRDVGGGSPEFLEVRMAEMRKRMSEMMGEQAK
jgi:hypothetical protein